MQLNTPTLSINPQSLVFLFHCLLLAFLPLSLTNCAPRPVNLPHTQVNRQQIDRNEDQRKDEALTDKLNADINPTFDTALKESIALHTISTELVQRMILLHQRFHDLEAKWKHINTVSDIAKSELKAFLETLNDPFEQSSQLDLDGLKAQDRIITLKENIAAKILNIKRLCDDKLTLPESQLIHDDKSLSEVIRKACAKKNAFLESSLLILKSEDLKMGKQGEENEICKHSEHLEPQQTIPQLPREPQDQGHVACLAAAHAQAAWLELKNSTWLDSFAREKSELHDNFFRLNRLLHLMN